MSEPGQPLFLYVVDTSFLIEIHKRYPQKLCPGIWKDLEVLVKPGGLLPRNS